MMQVGRSTISWRTFTLIAVGGVLLVALALAGPLLGMLLPADKAEPLRALLSDAGAVIFDIFAATALLFAAQRYGSKNPLRRIWLLLGIGIASYTIGDVIWTVLDVGAKFKNVPYPSAADVFYLAMYVILAVGLFRADRAFRRIADVERALMVEIVLAFLASIVVYVFVSAPVIADSTSSLAVKALAVAYPIGDIVVLLAPAFFIVLAAAAVRKSQSVLQWRVLAIGLGVMALADVTFAWLDFTGRYSAGHPVDFVWMLSLLIIAVAGSLAADQCVDHAAMAPSAGGSCEVRT